MTIYEARALCKPADFDRHLSIVRLVWLGASCRSAATMVVNQIGGSKRVRAANFDRLYRNHLKNAQAYRDHAKAIDEFADLSARFERAHRAFSRRFREEHEHIRHVFSEGLAAGITLPDLIRFHGMPPGGSLIIDLPKKAIATRM